MIHAEHGKDLYRRITQFKYLYIGFKPYLMCIDCIFFQEGTLVVQILLIHLDTWQCNIILIVI